MSFYEYRQNNSGGAFDIEPENGISVSVVIEADSASEADDKAGTLGIYFDGVATGGDCGCCGDRWHPAYGDGDPEPSCYGNPVSPDWTPGTWKRAGEDMPELIVHYKDGSIVGFGPHVVLREAKQAA